MGAEGSSAGKSGILFRAGSGILLVDKPRGPSSHQVTAWVGRMLGISVGHSGTLDPMVSGVLVVMLGRAVKLAPLLLQTDKEYVVLMRLHGEVTEEELQHVLQEFEGRIYQRPPRRSAVKRSLRIRTIQRLELLDREGRDVLIRVSCDAGTYIRSLCHHIGLRLGTGAHMQELRRTRSGAFTEAEAWTLQEISTAVESAAGGETGMLERMILPTATAVSSLPKVTIRDAAVDAICHGASLAAVGILEHDEFRKGDAIAILTRKGELVAVGEALIASGTLKGMSSGLAIAPRAVIMGRGTYPRGWKKSGLERRESQNSRIGRG